MCVNLIFLHFLPLISNFDTYREYHFSFFAAKVIIHQTLSVLEDIVESISGESTKSRQICYQSLQESVQVSLALFPAFIHQSGITIGQAFML